MAAYVAGTVGAAVLANVANDPVNSLNKIMEVIKKIISEMGSFMEPANFKEQKEKVQKMVWQVHEKLTKEEKAHYAKFETAHQKSMDALLSARNFAHVVKAQMNDVITKTANVADHNTAAKLTFALIQMKKLLEELRTKLTETYAKLDAANNEVTECGSGISFLINACERIHGDLVRDLENAKDDERKKGYIWSGIVTFVAPLASPVIWGTAIPIVECKKVGDLNALFKDGIADMKNATAPLEAMKLKCDNMLDELNKSKDDLGKIECGLITFGGTLSQCEELLQSPGMEQIAQSVFQCLPQNAALVVISCDAYLASHPIE